MLVDFCPFYQGLGALILDPNPSVARSAIRSASLMFPVILQQILIHKPRIEFLGVLMDVAKRGLVHLKSQSTGVCISALKLAQTIIKCLSRDPVFSFNNFRL